MITMNQFIGLRPGDRVEIVSWFPGKSSIPLFNRGIVKSQVKGPITLIDPLAKTQQYVTASQIKLGWSPAPIL